MQPDRNRQAVQATRFIHEDPVRQVDGAPGLVFRLGTQQVVLRGSGCAGFLPGWQARFVFSGFAPFLLMQLAHEDGREAIWFLDSAGDRLSDHIARLEPRDRSLLRRAAGPVLGGLVRSLLQDPLGELSAQARGFLALDEACRLDLLALCRDLLAEAPLELLSLTNMREGLLADPGGDRPMVMLQRACLLDLLGRDLQASLPGIVAEGRFRIPSPAGGEPIAAQGSLCLDDFHFAYRFVEPSGGLVFYLIAGHEHSQVYGLYLPRTGLLLHRPEHKGWAEGSRQFLPDALSHHLILHGAALAGYLSSPPRGVSVPMRAPPRTHIGHQLWNELSGIERFLAGAGEAGPLPEWLVPDGERPVEFYGRIDDLFPRLRGHVRRGLRHSRDLIDYAYAEGRLVFRATDDFVSADLRRRLLTHAATVSGGLPALDRLDGSPAWPVLLLGLRVENRTLTDLGGFYGRLIAAVRARHGQARFVVDGHNVAEPGGVKHHSHGEQAAGANATIAAEYAILDALRAEHPGVEILSAVGLTVPDNLRLIARCDGFVSMWGAGLAKYRWACNRPGYVMTGSWNLAHRADLHIYELPEMMEAPAPLRWLPAEKVTDQPDSPALILPIRHPEWSNFSIDEDAAIDGILDFVASLAPGA